MSPSIQASAPSYLNGEGKGLAAQCRCADLRPGTGKVKEHISPSVEMGNMLTLVSR